MLQFDLQNDKIDKIVPRLQVKSEVSIVSDLTKIKPSELPSDKEEIQFEEDSNTFKITISQSAATKNMQHNFAAFEAWSLVVKSAGYARVILAEKEHKYKMDKNEKRHYNRFLYRVLCFNKGFEWFDISAELQDKIKAFEKTELTKELFINAPLSEPKEPDEKSHEAVMEMRLTKDKNNSRLNLMLGTDIGKFYQQLPVGLFEGGVKTDNAIFPSDKAAIDIWGLSGSVFHLIELKVKSNTDLGVLSEVFFYACFINDMLCGRRLETKESAELLRYKKDGEFYRGYTQLTQAKIDSVVAYILTEKKHGKLDDAFAELQNCDIKGIEFAKAIRYPLFEEVNE